VGIADYAEDEGGPARVADAGRAILGHEAFRVRTRADRDLVVVMRTRGTVDATVLRAQGPARHTLEIAEARLEAFAEGRSVGPVTFRPPPGWTEVLLRIPAAALGEGSTPLRLQGRYASYQYWFYQ
jgi:hypothetical protein